MMGLSVEAMRSGVLWVGEPGEVSQELRASTRLTGRYVRLPPPRKHTSQMMYVMKHYPGNTNNSWQRQLFSDVSAVVASSCERAARLGLAELRASDLCG